MDDQTPTVQITVTGEKKLGATHAILATLASLDVEIIDLEHNDVRDRLTIVMLLASPTTELEEIVKAVAGAAIPFHLQVDYSYGRGDSQRRHKGRAAVCVLGSPLKAAEVAKITATIVECEAFIDRIRRLSSWPVTTLEFSLSGADVATLRSRLSTVAADSNITVSVAQRGLGRRGKHLIVMDVDSTLIQQEAIDLLAKHAGVEDQVKQITDRAMAGELDFAESLRERVGCLNGLDQKVIDQVYQQLKLTPGARTLIRALKRAGNRIAIVSGGFQQTVAPLADSLGIDYYEANMLEIVDGKLTGNLVGPIVDRKEKANALRRFAAMEGLPLSRTVAIGDGANDIDMLAVAGLGIAFNAKPVLRDSADTSVQVPYLDSVAYLLGMSREEIDEADQFEVH